MKPPLKLFLLMALMLGSIAVLSSFLTDRSAGKPRFTFPYKQMGLTERQAAAHLLSRFSYGATPGEVDAVIKIGLEKWFEQQLEGNLPDDSVNNMLNQYDGLKLSNAQVVATYPRNNQVIQMAAREGVVNQDSARTNPGKYRPIIAAYMQKKGMKPQQELFREFYNQKVLRAAYSQNQLHEMLTDFWFNHFNVSTTKNDCSEFIPDYERDVIRPNVTGKFGDLLLATAKSPAMLYYLDNFSSAGVNPAMQINQPRGGRRPQFMQNQIGANPAMQNNPQAGNRPQFQNPGMANNPPMAQLAQRVQQARKVQGLNENYAREVMELHTLGVDGGYTQADVTQAAKVLTGWTVYPMGGYGGGGGVGGMGRQLLNASQSQLADRGFVHDGDFFFTANRHDVGDKIVLGKKFTNNGYQEGVDLLSMLAHHPSTAKFITKKLAVRFVSDAPAQSLLDKMVKTFTDKDGDIKEVLITMATAPEFWSKDALREKTKSPFELVISSVRSLNAKIDQPYQLYTWADKMGQKMYAYQAPTGFPDKGQYWINTGALLNRMNFGLALASGRIPGVKIDLAALNNHHEPESPQAALAIYGKLIMPERNLTATVKQLTPMLSDPNLGKKISDAAVKAAPATPADMTGAQDMSGQDMMAASGAQGQGRRPNGGQGGGRGRGGFLAMQTVQGDNSMLAQVVGVIFGSPEFQRR